ncbi:TrkA-C domain-containing protein [Geopseudomonas sagittaria]|uniref:TrkA-C domain-containing protein n=1 Tax=Geopseudomonas sagittaria TaxID=1135990 RepID=A0A1I5Z6Y3_9GAMM|nr:SLC13 family permease [Pseudomonas sagittaria]SFQ52232.1 TrkA-C domain-containing protein [Pseudomonas sagittaria]
MAGSQVAIVAVLLAALTLFLWGRWRHDLVAMAALLACVLLGLVPVEEAFAGFGHPAVITVACVLVLGHGLQSSGAVDILAQRLLPGGVGPTASLLALLVLAAVLSGFMNNVGALALLMPIALQMAAKHQLAPGRVLMPLSFASILGGMTTLIGTPPNLIVSGYREASGLGGFAMFDFAPVGLAVALFGVLFIGLLGWRWVPTHGPAASGGFESEAYLSEVSITEGSKAANKTLHEVEQMLDEAEAQIVGLVRHDIRVVAPGPRRRLHAGDILIVEVEPESLAKVLSSLGLHLVEDVPAPPPESAASAGTAESAETEPAGRPPLVDGQRVAEEGQAAAQQAPREAARSGAEEVVIQELVVMPGSSLIRRSATDVELRSRYGINLLAISRQGLRMIRRLRSTPVRAGDVLLMQGGNEALAGFAGQFGCLPLAPRDIRVPRQGQALLAGLVMALSVAVAASDLLPPALAFAAGALAFAVLGIVPPRSLYTAIDWPVIVLLGAMLPVADAMLSSGAAGSIARFLLDYLARGDAVLALVLLLVVTMFLSDLMNNAATAAVMCPIALSSAQLLAVNADAFLMAIAVGASCAFLTPIGHQNNTLILGPGGLRFGDFWRLGLALEVIVVAVGVPMLLWVWPL